MSDSPKSPGSARQDRLKAALRENLKRRKVQARERATDTLSEHERGHGDQTIGDKDVGAPARRPSSAGD